MNLFINVPFVVFKADHIEFNTTMAPQNIIILPFFVGRFVYGFIFFRELSFMSSIDSERLTRSDNFSLGNSKKSQAVIAGVSSAWMMTFVEYLTKNTCSTIRQNYTLSEPLMQRHISCPKCW